MSQYESLIVNKVLYQAQHVLIAFEVKTTIIIWGNQVNAAKQVLSALTEFVRQTRLSIASRHHLIAGMQRKCIKVDMHNVCCIVDRDRRPSAK